MVKKYKWAEDKVMRVIRPLYGLKQSGRNWQLRFRREMKALGFEPLVADSAVYRHAATGTLVISYVDDLLVIAAKDKQVNSLKEGLEEQNIEVEWAAPDMEIWYLGMRVEESGKAITTD